MRLRLSIPEDFMTFEPSPEDKAEARAMGIEPQFPPHTECISMEHNGKVLAIGGNVGDQVWFVTAKGVWKLPKEDKQEFRRLIIMYRNVMLERYESIWNFVWVGNTSHIRFLKTIGAVFYNEYADPVTKQFQLFIIQRKEV
ncbi:MAG: hypothetical protein [Caudoviricetes sp.]|nr:MAG: hypothetical protein [Caudoviricetes sp.]